MNVETGITDFAEMTVVHVVVVVVTTCQHRGAYI